MTQQANAPQQRETVEDAIETGLRDALIAIQDVDIRVPIQPLYPILRQYGKRVADASQPAFAAPDKGGFRIAGEAISDAVAADVSQLFQERDRLRDEVATQKARMKLAYDNLLMGNVAKAKEILST